MYIFLVFVYTPLIYFNTGLFPVPILAFFWPNPAVNFSCISVFTLRGVEFKALLRGAPVMCTPLHMGRGLGYCKPLTSPLRWRRRASGKRWGVKTCPTSPEKSCWQMRGRVRTLDPLLWTWRHRGKIRVWDLGIEYLIVSFGIMDFAKELDGYRSKSLNILLLTMYDFF